MKTPSSIVVRGAVAGFFAATALALWFFVIDAAQGRPFHTPGFLAGVLLGIPHERVESELGLIVMYTALHYGLFLMLGVAVSWLMTRIQTAPTFLLGAVLGFLLFDLVFYAGVILTGVDVVDALGWSEVLAGNVMAGIVLMAYLHLTSPVKAPSWRELLRQHRILREGLISGVLGAAAVAIWFLIFDIAGGRGAFFTPASLGSAFFLGARDVAAVQVNAMTVGAYTVLHIAAFISVGIIAAALVTQAEKEPPLILAAVLLFVTFETLFIGLLAIVAEWILGALGWWSIALGNLIAAGAIGYYLWREHPDLRKHLKEHGRELEEPA